jgi:ATP-binding cassette subfamily B protein
MEDKKQKSNIVYPEVKLRHVFHYFWQGLKQQKWLFWWCLILISGANIISVITPTLYKQFFDIIAAPGQQSEVARQLIIIIIQIGILNAFIWLFYRLAVWFNIIYSADAMARLKQQAYDYLIKHSYSFFTSNFTGTLVQRVNRFARAFEIFTDQINYNLLPLFVRMTAITIIVWFTNKWIALIILAWALIFLIFNIIFSRWKVKYDILAAEQDSKTTGYLADTITNQNTIQLFSGYKFESKGYKKVTTDQATTQKRAWNLDSISDAVQSFLIFIIEFLLFYFAIKYWEMNLISVGVFVLLQIYIISLMEKLWSFSRVIRQFYQAYADSKEMVEMMLLSHGIKDAPTATELKVNKGEIKLEKIGFTFNKTRHALKNINLEIKPGEKIALVGPSGAGKTTFVRLLLRLYSPTQGIILIDGQDISKVTQDSLRQNISMVPQDPILFHRTLAENIAYGKRGATMAEIRRAAKLAHCDEFINNLPQGLSTLIKY